jgi:hypothetical protein
MSDAPILKRADRTCTNFDVHSKAYRDSIFTAEGAFLGLIERLPGHLPVYHRLCPCLPVRSTLTRHRMLFERLPADNAARRTHRDRGQGHRPERPTRADIHIPDH